MRSQRHHSHEETLRIALDDATVERLRAVAAQQGIEVEQLIVQALHLASWHSDDFPPDGRIDDEDDRSNTTAT